MDGNVDYLGRNDFQVKIRGFRIELGEIEARLLDCAGVREAVVLAADAGTGAQRLVAYLVPQVGTTLAPAALHDALATCLPDYMIPAVFMALDGFPLNASGKIDRKALPAPCVANRGYVAPHSALESGMAAIWQTLLGVERVGQHDNFFELGGHSLLAVQLVSRLRLDLGIDTSVRQLFTHPTLAGLSATLAAQAGARYAHLVPVQTQGTAPPLFLVHPGEGEVGYAFALAACLDDQLPVYALAARGFAAGEMPFSAVEQMARAYLREMRMVQPHGPYRIAGWSAGGTIAWEIAHQLVGADEELSFLGLFDTASEYAGAVGAAGFGAWLRSLDWLPASSDATLDTQLRTLADAEDDDALLACAQAAGLMPGGIDPATLRRHLAVRHGIHVALRSYHRPPLPLEVTLFAAADVARADRTLGWGDAASGRLRLALVPGDHYSMMAPEHIGALGAALGSALADGAGRAPIATPEAGYTPCVALQFGRPGASPLFCIPGAGASVTAFTAIAQALEPGVPVYGLQPRGLCGTMAPYSEIAATARAYVRAIRAVAPHGPYRLLGHSFGGWIATEMAIQLEAAGEPVAALAVLDSRVPRLPADGAEWHGPVDVLVRLASLFEQKLGHSLRLGVADFAPLGHAARLALLLERLVEARLMPRGTRIATLDGLVRTFGANINTPYAPTGPYAGVLLFAAAAAGADGRDGPEALAAGWQQFAAQSRTWTSTGNHMTMLAPPHVDALVRWLSPFLKESQC
jgi:thioesterase domain-containing protein/aryl carrier-like protein